MLDLFEGLNKTIEEFHYIIFFLVEKSTRTLVNMIVPTKISAPPSVSGVGVKILEGTLNIAQPYLEDRGVLVKKSLSRLVSEHCA